MGLWCGAKVPGVAMIDWERVAELRAEVGEDGFAEVIALFLDETDEVTARLGAATGDLCRDLHFLKGSALNLGFRQLAQLCQEGERKCALGAQAEVDVSALIQLYRSSKDAIARLPAA